MSHPKRQMKILAMNVQGLNPHKFNEFNKMIDDETYDVIIIIETWYACEDLYATHPNTLAVSRKPNTPLNEACRGSAGILILTKERNDNRIIKADENLISFCIGVHTLAAVYFPPSMDNRVIAALLSQIPYNSTVIGDFNFELIPHGNSQRIRMDKCNDKLNSNTCI